MEALAPYLERVAGNEYVQERLAEAVDSLRAAYVRASRQSAAQAAQDRKLRRRLGRAIVAGRDAAVTIRTGRKPERRSRKSVLLLGVVAIAAAAVGAGPLRRKLAAGPSSALESAADGHAAEPQSEPSTV
ncbi:MAG: hypothetical protein M3155_00400 [Actinomycetota bacterium]|nr:hypothetical protein [Actinomycetota bacterium]